MISANFWDQWQATLLNFAFPVSFLVNPKLPQGRRAALAAVWCQCSWWLLCFALLALYIIQISYSTRRGREGAEFKLPARRKGGREEKVNLSTAFSRGFFKVGECWVEQNSWLSYYHILHFSLLLISLEIELCSITLDLRLSNEKICLHQLDVNSYWESTLWLWSFCINFRPLRVKKCQAEDIHWQTRNETEASRQAPCNKQAGLLRIIFTNRVPQNALC